MDTARSAAQSVRLEGLRKEFGGSIAVKDVTLTVEPGELVTLLGPSGCGKTTTLRMIAGLLPQNGGEIYFGSSRVDHLPANRRNVGLVFQNYALFPHMTVSQNIAFGLRMRHWERERTATRVAELLALVRLEGLGDRKPSQLSGGQQQRVAVARALAFHPNLVLLDEPLSNLDAKLREQVRLDLRDIQRETHQTTIFVTHDQDEALVMSDRVVLMNTGVIEQVADPRHLYLRPQTEFAARFIGANNLLAGRVVEGAVVVDGIEGAFGSYSVPDGAIDESVWLCVRPENIDFFAQPPVGSSPNPRVGATVADMVFQGSSVLVDLDVRGVGVMRAEKSAILVGDIKVGDSIEVGFGEAHIVARTAA